MSALPADEITSLTDLLTSLGIPRARAQDAATRWIVDHMGRGWRRTRATAPPPWKPAGDHQRARADAVRAHAARARAQLATTTEET